MYLYTLWVVSLHSHFIDENNKMIIIEIKPFAHGHKFVNGRDRIQTPILSHSNSNVLWLFHRHVARETGNDYSLGFSSKPTFSKTITCSPIGWAPLILCFQSSRLIGRQPNGWSISNLIYFLKWLQ